MTGNKSRRNQKTNDMQNVNLHKQRLITVAMAALGLIFLFLPWATLGAGIGSKMGYAIVGGIISAIAFAGIIVDSLVLGDKTKPFDKTGKLIAIIAFAIAFLMTLIVAFGGSEKVSNGVFEMEIKRTAGIGVWLTLILEIAGLLWITGVLDKLMQQKTSSSGGFPPSAPPPPPPPAR
jgi:hypothetical protein